MSPPKILAFPVIVLAGLFGIVPAEAAPVLAPVIYYTDVDPVLGHNPGTWAQYQATGGYISADMYSKPLSIDAFISNQTKISTQATTQATFQYSLNGPINELVPVQIFVYLSSQDSVGTAPEYTALASFSNDGQSILACASIPADTCAANGSVGSHFSGTVSFEVESNEAHTITLTTSVSGFGGNIFSGSGAYNFIIDPSFADADLFTLATSSGATVVPLPLPGALGMFGSGLATLGYAGWRRTRRKAAGTSSFRRKPESSAAPGWIPALRFAAAGMTIFLCH